MSVLNNAKQFCLCGQFGDKRMLRCESSATSPKTVAYDTTRFTKVTARLGHCLSPKYDLPNAFFPFMTLAARRWRRQVLCGAELANRRLSTTGRLPYRSNHTSSMRQPLY